LCSGYKLKTTYVSRFIGYTKLRSKPTT